MNNPKPPSKKNSLTKFKPVEPILPTSKPAPAEKLVTARAAAPKARGPKPKPPAEKRSHRVLLSLTETEGIKSKDKAGLAGEATTIYAFLHEHGYFK